jgi:hypothetical protein
MAEYLEASGQARTLSSATARAIERNRSNRGGSSSSTAVGEKFILPESWRQELLAQIKQDEKTIPHDLLLWEA